MSIEIVFEVREAERSFRHCPNYSPGDVCGTEAAQNTYVSDDIIEWLRQAPPGSHDGIQMRWTATDWASRDPYSDPDDYSQYVLPCRLDVFIVFHNPDLAVMFKLKWM